MFTEKSFAVDLDYYIPRIIVGQLGYQLKMKL